MRAVVGAARADDPLSVDWLHHFSSLGRSPDHISMVEADGVGGAYFIGTTRGELSFPAGGEDSAFVGRYNPDGTLMWLQQ
jgi:hypothetical protein